MSSVRKEHIKALKGPDQFQVKVMNGMDWAVKNARVLVYTFVPVAAVVLILVGYRFVQTQRKDSRLEALGKVQVVYDAESKQAADLQKPLAKKLQDLEAAAAKEGGKAPALTPQQDAEKAALRKQIEAIKPNHTASAAQFLTFYKQNDNYAEGWLAGMMAARALIDQHQLADAVPVLEGIASKAKTAPFYQTLANLAVASLYEEQGAYDKELAAIDTLDKSADAELKPKLQLMRGRALYLKGDKAAAKTALNTLIDTYGSSPEAQKARSLLTLLTN